MATITPCPKPKVVFVLGATASGKSKLAITLAVHFNGEVINSDKIQVYDGLPVITNKVTEEECAGVPHHLLGGVRPDDDFTADDFCREASRTISSVLARGCLPIIAGGSNTYIEALVEGDGGAFRTAHDCLFLWVDVDPELHQWYISVRLDDMVQRGFVDEARNAFEAAADYSKGRRRAIGLPELDRYLRAERKATVDECTLSDMLNSALNEVKTNTSKLARRQVEKIKRLCTLDGWNIHRIDSTEFLARTKDGIGNEETWQKVVWVPSVEIVKDFLAHKPMHCHALSELGANRTLKMHEKIEEQEEQCGRD